MNERAAELMCRQARESRGRAAQGVHGHSRRLDRRLEVGTAPNHAIRVGVVNDLDDVAAARQRVGEPANVVTIPAEIERRVERRHHGEAQGSVGPRLDRGRHRVGSSPARAPIARTFSRALVVTKICTAGLTLG